MLNIFKRSTNPNTESPAQVAEVDPAPVSIPEPTLTPAAAAVSAAACAIPLPSDTPDSASAPTSAPTPAHAPATAKKDTKKGFSPLKKMNDFMFHPFQTSGSSTSPTTTPTLAKELEEDEKDLKKNARVIDDDVEDDVIEVMKVVKKDQIKGGDIAVSSSSTLPIDDSSIALGNEIAKARPFKGLTKIGDILSSPFKSLIVTLKKEKDLHPSPASSPSATTTTAGKSDATRPAVKTSTSKDDSDVSSLSSPKIPPPPPNSPHFEAPLDVKSNFIFDDHEADESGPAEADLDLDVDHFNGSDDENPKNPEDAFKKMGHVKMGKTEKKN